MRIAIPLLISIPSSSNAFEIWIFLDLDDMQIHHVSTTQSPSSSGVSFRFAEEFHSILYSYIELADQEREERPDASNIEPIFRDSSLSDVEDILIIMMSKVPRITLSARMTLSKIHGGWESVLSKHCNSLAPLACSKILMCKVHP